MTQVITDPSQASREWLNGVLRRTGQLGDGEVTAVHLRGSEVGARSSTHRLDVDYRGYTRLPRRLSLRLATRPGESRGGREAEFYLRVAPIMWSALPPEDVPFPRVLDAAYAPETGSSHVLLQDLRTTHLAGDPSLPPGEAHCEGAIDILAALHAFWWQHPRLGSEIGEDYSADRIASIVEQGRRGLAAWLGFMGDRVSPGRRALYEQVCRGWPVRYAERLATGQGLTLVHGNACATSLLLPRDPLRDRVVLAGWHSWRLGAGTDDLAYMMAAHWYPERRTRLETTYLERYLRRMSEAGVTGYGWDDCWYDYRASVLRVLFDLIGGWRSDQEPALWYDRIERASQACEGLGCARLLP